MPYYVANPKVSCSVELEQSLCLEILLLPAKYKESRIFSLDDVNFNYSFVYFLGTSAAFLVRILIP